MSMTQDKNGGTIKVDHFNIPSSYIKKHMKLM